MPQQSGQAQTDRLLVHLHTNDALRQDLERIYGLGLAARPDDPELIAALWGTQRVAEGLEALARRHDFVLAGQFRLHDTVRTFLQRYLLDPLRRYEVREANRRAVTMLERRLAIHHQHLTTLEQRTGNEEWTTDLLALAWHRFWVNDQAGWATLLAVLPAAIAYKPELGRVLLDLATHFVTSAVVDFRTFCPRGPHRWPGLGLTARLAGRGAGFNKDAPVS